MCDRDPITGDGLGSQPTLSRFENSVTRFQLLTLSTQLAEKIICQQQKRRRGKRRPKRIIIDLDQTHDPTHGQQPMTFFNGYYDTWCYLPLIVTISFDKECRKHPIVSVLRPGNAGAMAGTLAILKHLVPLIRKLFPSVRLYFRADGAYCNPDLLDWLEEKSIYCTHDLRTSRVI
ncbi:MAG: transposase [Candidatus Euphemobacter frigidus]|nr:transposase [Candidatus Euphemobacter frigidus]MDP8274763.1 transposase [Candidatus Euphemobacter frigidus]